MSERARTQRGAQAAGDTDTATIECGVIMPISATATYSEEHWRQVQTLIHRGIAGAGFVPRNVWESTTSDRISERIIGSIFEVPVAVADISDLNPNVMLELGLRLASKKPTIVVANNGGEIPFDIRDFHATLYPPDLNILGMEDFFRRLTKALQEKHSAFAKGESYTPFLGKVIIDVASPETRELGANDLLLSRLDEISTRLGAVEGAVRRSRTVGANNVVTGIRNSRAAGIIGVEIPDEQVHPFIAEATSLYEIDGVEKAGVREGIATLNVSFSSAPNLRVARDLIRQIAVKHGGDLEVPF